MAGEATALAKPVMGTSVPAPAWRASLWYRPSPVNSADRNTSDTDVAVAASSSFRPRNLYQSLRAWPRQQMAPPTRNASATFFHRGDLGLMLFRYS